MSTEIVQMTEITKSISTETLLAVQKFQSLLNKEPIRTELTKTPDGKAFSLPISRIEMKLDELFFGMWWTEHFVTKQVLNEFVGELELVVVHPVTGVQIRRVGAAAVQITQDSGASIGQFMETKKKNALDLTYPKLKAECVKNAAISLGKTFGRDLNRKDETVAQGYNPLIKIDPSRELPEAKIKDIIDRSNRVSALFGDCTTKAQLEAIKSQCDADVFAMVEEEFNAKMDGLK